jgi:hypothetical protein
MTKAVGPKQPMFAGSKYIPVRKKHHQAEMGNSEAAVLLDSPTLVGLTGVAAG